MAKRNFIDSGSAAEDASSEKHVFTELRKRFADEYLKDLNGAAAWVRAGGTVKGAKQGAYRALNCPLVQKYLQEKMDKRSIRTQIDADEVLLDIRRVGTKAEDAKDWGNALRSLELQGKHLKLFTDKTELTGENGGPVQVQEIRFVAPKSGRGN